MYTNGVCRRRQPDKGIGFMHIYVHVGLHVQNVCIFIQTAYVGFGSQTKVCKCACMCRLMCSYVCKRCKSMHITQLHTVLHNYIPRLHAIVVAAKQRCASVLACAEYVHYMHNTCIWCFVFMWIPPCMYVCA